MMMGFGCNAAGVIACRVIDSPRERLIAILTNVFVPCNGRFPTLITVASLFVAGRWPRPGTFAASLDRHGRRRWRGGLWRDHDALRVMDSAHEQFFAANLRPSSSNCHHIGARSFLRVLYTSLIDRTAFVLYRACVVAAPAGGIIWLMANREHRRRLACFSRLWIFSIPLDDCSVSTA